MTRDEISSNDTSSKTIINGLWSQNHKKNVIIIIIIIVLLIHCIEYNMTDMLSSSLYIVKKAVKKVSRKCSEE